MIRCHLIQLTRNRSGQLTRTGRLVSGEELTVGRASDSSIHLPDPRANLLCAVIGRAEDGRLTIDGEGTLLSINESYEHSAVLAPGMRIQIGPYALEIEQLEGNDADLTLTVELVHPLLEAQAASSKAVPRTLAEAGCSRRRLAYWLAGLVAVLFLAWPLAQSLFPKVGLHDWSAAQWWNPGAMSPGHHAFAGNCLQCHAVAFRGVSNSACLKCHAGTGDHIRSAAVEKHVLGGMACTECHREHQNGRLVAKQGDATCIACHADLKARYPGTRLPDVRDFSSHPEFRLAIRTGQSPQDVHRATQLGAGSTAAHENSGLKFPHEQHVGLVQIPGSLFDVKDLKCVNCHVPAEGGLGFQPLKMKAMCYDCHQGQLEYTREGADLKFPHGSPEAVNSMLHDYYATLALKQGKSPDWVQSQMTAAVQSLSQTGGCAFCHFPRPEKDDSTRLHVPAPVFTAHWFPAARFPHAQHRSQACAACHDVEHSTSSTDVLIPPMKSCKQCHAGRQSEAKRISTRCIDCHAFHAVEKNAP